MLDIQVRQQVTAERIKAWSELIISPKLRLKIVHILYYRLVTISFSTLAGLPPTTTLSPKLFVTTAPELPPRCSKCYARVDYGMATYPTIVTNVMGFASSKPLFLSIGSKDESQYKCQLEAQVNSYHQT